MPPLRLFLQATRSLKWSASRWLGEILGLGVESAAAFSQGHSFISSTKAKDFPPRLRDFFCCELSSVAATLFSLGGEAGGEEEQQHYRWQTHLVQPQQPRRPIRAHFLLGTIESGERRRRNIKS